MSINKQYSILLLSFLLFAFCKVKAQESTSAKTVAPRFTMRVNCGIPKITSSQLLRNSFTGVVFAEANLNCRLFSNVFVGAGYSYSYFKTPKSLSDLNVYTNMQMQHGYVKFGYDHYLSSNKFISISLNAGYNYTFYQGVKYATDSVIGKYPTQFSSSFAEPQFTYYILNDDGIALGFHVGYYYNFKQFDIRNSGLDKWLTNANSLTNKWNISSINIGLGIYYGIGK